MQSSERENFGGIEKKYHRPIMKYWAQKWGFVYVFPNPGCTGGGGW